MTTWHYCKPCYLVYVGVQAQLQQPIPALHSQPDAPCKLVPRSGNLSLEPQAQPLQDGLTMLLSRVALGRVTRGSGELRRPPDGFDACTHSHRMGHRPDYGNRMDIYCVYDNAQAYPDYIITYSAALRPAV